MPTTIRVARVEVQHAVEVRGFRFARWAAIAKNEIYAMWRLPTRITEIVFEVVRCVNGCGDYCYDVRALGNDATEDEYKVARDYLQRCIK